VVGSHYLGWSCTLRLEDWLTLVNYNGSWLPGAGIVKPLEIGAYDGLGRSRQAFIDGSGATVTIHYAFTSLLVARIVVGERRRHGVRMGKMDLSCFPFRCAALFSSIQSMLRTEIMHQRSAFLSTLILGIVTSAALVAFPAPAATAKEKELKPGDKVVLLLDVDVRRDNRRAGTIERGTIVQVKETDGLSISVDKPVRGQFSALAAIPLTDAESWFSDRLQRDPNDTMSLAIRGLMRHALKNKKQGLADLTEAIGLAAGDGRLAYMLGKAHLSDESLYEAKQSFDAACTQSNQSARHWTAKGKLDLRIARAARGANRRQKLGEVEKAFSKALRFEENYVPALLGLASYRLAQRNPVAALVPLEQAIKQFDKDEDPAPRDPRAYSLMGRALVDQDDLSGAVKQYDTAIDLEPDLLEALLGRGMALFYSGERERAEVDFDAVEKLYPTTFEARFDRAQKFIRLERYETAIADLSFIKQRDSRRYYEHSAISLRSLARAGNKQYDLAIADLKYLLKRIRAGGSSSWFDISGRLALLHAENKDYVQALSVCEEMKELATKNQDSMMPRILRLRAHIYEKQGSLRKAMADFKEVIKLDRGNIDAISGRAMLYEKLGKYEEMLEDLQRCAQLAPKSATAQNNLAWLLATCPDEAIRDGEQAVELATAACESQRYRSAGTIDTLAAAYAEQGDFKEALQAQQRAVRLAVGDNMKELSARIELYEKEQPYREDNRLPESERNAFEEESEADGQETTEPVEPQAGQTSADPLEEAST